MNPIAYAIPLFMITMALEAWMAHRQHRKVYDVADTVGSLTIGLISQLGWSFFNLFALWLYNLAYTHWAFTPWPMDQVSLWVLALLAYDFLFYAYHRASHEVSLLWGVHIAHHSSTFFNLSTALRQPLFQPLVSCWFFIPMAVAGVPPLMFVVVGLINLLYQYWVHTELIGTLGWVDWVFVTPANHRVHHGQNDYCVDKNYGGILVVWDRCFGTYQAERQDTPVIYGVRTPLNSLNPLWANVHHYVALLKHCQAQALWRDRLKAWFKGPVSHPMVDTQTRITASKATQIYVAIQSLLVIGFLLHFLNVFPTLALTDALFYALALVGSGVCVCGLMEGAIWSRPAEALRLIGMGMWVVWA